jgi:hypothetical protein
MQLVCRSPSVKEVNRHTGSEPPRTITHRLGATAERYLLTKAVATRRPARGPMEPPDVGPWVSQPRG